MEELVNLINELIIDNNTNQVTPARVRMVLTAIVQALYTGGGVPTISAVNPLVFDGFTGVLDYQVTPFKGFRPIAKGWKPGTTPTDETTNYPNEPLLGDFCFGTDSEGYFYITRWVTGSDINLIENHKILLSLRQPLEGEPGFEE